MAIGGGGLRERVLDAGHQAGQAIMGQTEPHGQRIGGAEANAVDITLQRIRILTDDLLGFLAILLIDLGGEARRDIVALQEEHDLADILLLRPALEDQVTLMDADAGASVSRFGSNSSTASVCSPNVSTMRSAVFGPIPLMTPEPR